MFYTVTAEVLVVGLSAVVVAFWAALFYGAERARRRKALESWASNYGYKVLHAQQPILSEAGPFPVCGSKAQQAFRITIEDKDGAIRSGWILLGSAFRGLKSPKVKLLWDEPEST